MSTARAARVVERICGEWQALTFMLGMLVGGLPVAPWTAAGTANAVASVEVPATTVQETLRTWYLGDAATFTETLPCGSEHGYALPAGVMVAWCVAEDDLVAPLARGLVAPWARGLVAPLARGLVT